jgi:hypothetical protein
MVIVPPPVKRSPEIASFLARRHSRVARLADPCR